MRIAIFGGSFDPIHKAHLEIIKSLARLGMDKIIIVPTNITYYKKNKAMLTFNERLELAKMAIKSVDSLENINIEVSDIERNIGENEGYAHTLMRLRESSPKDEYYTVIGSDSYNYIKTWREYKKILEYSRLIVVTRPNNIINEEASLPYIRLDMDMDISSTKIREEIKSFIINSLK